MISPQRAIDIIGELASTLDEESEQHQALRLAALHLFQVGVGASSFYAAPEMQRRLEDARTSWLKMHPTVDAGTTVMLCGILHVVSFGRHNIMQLSPVFF